MNCLLEAVAGAYLAVRAKVIPPPMEEEVYSAHYSLENCKNTMERREREYADEARKLAEAAISCKRRGDLVGARAKALERRRVVTRLEKLHSGLNLVTSQLEAIKASEIDREVIQALKNSSNIIKKAGIGVDIADADQIMDDLDKQLRDIKDISRSMATPLNQDEDTMDIDAELELMMESSPLLQEHHQVLPTPASKLPAIKEDAEITQPHRQNAMIDT